MKRYTMLLILWEMQIKTTVGYSLMPLEWLLSKRQETIHFGEDVDKKKLSLLVRMKIGAVNVKIVWSFLKKMKIRTIMWSSYSTSGCLFK